jgi:hypothetical protein
MVDAPGKFLIYFYLIKFLKNNYQTKYKLLLVTKKFPKYYVGNGGCASEIFICRIN